MANPFAKYVQPEERENPFAKYAQPEPVKDAVENPFAKFVAPAPAAPTPTAQAEESGFLRQAADIPIGVTQGLLGGVRMIANAFGADSDTSKLIKGYEDKIGELLSAQAKNDKKEISRILKEAEDKGVLDQLVAAGKAFATAPVDLTVQALGTSAPGIVAGLGTTLAGAPTAVAIGASSAVGAVMGAGEVKGNIYDATKEELVKIGVPEAKADKIAAEAQAYNGKNLDQILIASGIGAVTGGTGFESAAIKGLTGRILGKAVAKEGAEAVGKGVTRRVSEGVLKESVPEFIQGSQQQLAENIALQREGFDVPTGRGVVSQGALEAFSSLPLGAYAGYKDRGRAAQTTEDRLLADLDAQADREETAGEEGIDDFIAQQRAGVGAESRADVAGVSGVGAAEAAGVSDTGVPTAPREGGLAGVGAATTVTPEGTRAESGALEQQIKDLTRQRDRLEAAIEDTQYEGDYAGMQELQQQVNEFDAQIAALQQQLRTGRVEPTIEELETAAAQEEAEYAQRQEAQEQRKTYIREVVKANVDSALAEVSNYKDADEAADAYRGNVFDTLQEQGFELNDYDYNYANQQFDKVLEEARQAAQPKQTEVIKEEKPTTDFAALEAAERARHDEVRRIKEEQLALLTKAGRVPAKNSPARKKYDELEKQRVQAHWNWVESEQRLNTAKRAAEKGVPLQFVDPTAIALERAQQLYDANPEYSEDQFDAAYTALQKELKATNTVRRDEIDRAVEVFGNRLSELESQRKGAAPNIKPTFALPENYVHGTDYLTAQKIIQQGRLIPDAGKRMYSYSQFGRKAVYLTDRNGWWLDADKAAEGRAAVYDASVPFKIDPNANIREVNTQAELDAIAREIGEPDANSMMRKLSVENLDYEQAAREVKNLSFEEFVKDAVKGRRERLQRYKAPDADTVVDIPSWAAQDAKESPGFARSEEDILDSLRNQYDFLQNYEAQYKDADEVTQKLLDAGIDGIYIGPDFGSFDPEEYEAFVATLDSTRQAMPDATPPEVYDTAVEEYKKVNPTYFDRAGNPVASDQLALFRPELAVVDRARLAAARPSKPAFAPEDYARRPGETEEQYTERLAAQPTSRLAPEILELLQNNDLNGALRAVAARFSAGPKIRAFYGELATRIADLNLPTEIRVGDQRNLTRRSIDAFTRPEQVRLFAYIRNKFPAYFDQYFKDYDKADALETVYAGILNLSVDQIAKLSPVRAEYDTVKQAYIDSMPGISAKGAYYPTFDVLTLNDSVGRSNGLDYYTLLHESVHAATETLLNTPAAQRTAEQNDAITQLEELYELAQNNTNFDYYGLNNLSEFIAEAFTNKKFQDFLKSIPYAPARTNILKRFIQAVLNLVGIDNVAARTMVEAEKLFSAARPFQTLPAGPRFAGAKKPRIRGPVSKPDTWRTAEQVTTSLTDLFNDALKGRRSWDEVLKTVGPAMWDTSTGAFRSALLGMANLRQIGDLTATKFPQIQGAIRMIEKMLAYRGKKLNQASEIVKAWTTAQAKNPKQSELVGRVMLEATIRGQNPSALPTTDALRRAWDGLSPEFKKIYEDVRKFYADSVNEMVREMKQRAMGLPKEERQAMIRKINEQFGPDKLKQPYFPLRRFGTYWFQVGTGMNKEFYEFESRISRELAMRTRRRQLMNGNKQQQALAGTIAKGNGISELYNRNIGTTQVLKDVQEIIDGVGAADVDELKTELKDSLNQLIYLLLPQQSMRKMFINRKAIQGASSDMLRVFATTAVHSAYQQSRFKYAEPFLNNLNNARDYVRQLPIDADTKAVYDDYVKEVEARAKTILSNEDTSMSAKVAGKASEATFYFMLSAPFTSILNVLGFAQITMPYIGGRYGYAKTNAVILKNFGRYFKSMPTRTINPLREGRYMETSFPSIAEGGDLSPLMQRAADRFIEEGQINISLTNDIFDIGDRPSDLYTGKYNAVKKAISGLFHQSERLNREVTLLTVFELAYDKFRNEPKKDLRGVIARDAAGNPVKNTDDEAFELAIAEAKDIAGLSLGDFTRQMKPRYFTSPLMSVLTKFKQYPVMATYAVVRNFYFTFAAPFRTKEIADFRKQLEKDNLDPKVIDQRIAEAEAQRKQIYQEGRRRLAGILGVTFLLGGIEAQPFFSILVGPIVKMLGNDDDDDEFFNWENWFRNYMEEELGGYAGSMFEQLGIDKEKAAKLGRKTGEAVGRGVIPAITGGSLADRVSLDPKNLWYREGRYSPDIRESIIENVIANAGPVVGLGFNWVDAYKLMQEGQYQRAFEKAAPAIVSKPVSAARLSEEGAKTKSGVTLVDNFTATEIAMQAVGLQPERLAQAQKAAIEAKEKEQKIEDRRNTIMNRLWLERDNPDGFEVTLEEAGKFSERYPARKIDFSAIRESFQKRAKEAAEAEAFGAKINKKLRPEVEPMLRYGRE